MIYPRVAWSLLPAFVGSLLIAFGPGNGPMGLADDSSSQPSQRWTDTATTDHCEDAKDRRDDSATDSYDNHASDDEYAGGDEYLHEYDDYDDYDDGQYEDYDYIDDQQDASGRKSYKYVGYKYVETPSADPGDANQKQQFSHKYDRPLGAGFTLQYDQRYAESHMDDDTRGEATSPYYAPQQDRYTYEEYEAGYATNADEPDVEVALDDPGDGYRGYSDAYPNQQDAYPENMADAAASYNHKYEFSYPEAKYGNPEVLSNEIEQTEPDNTSDPDAFQRFDEADEVASGEPGDEKSQWFGPYDDETSVLGAVRSWTAWSLDELAMAIHGVSQRISAQ